MRLLIVMMDPPLPYFSAVSRELYALYKALVARGHEVTAFAACDSDQQRGQALELFPPNKCDLRLYPHAPQRSWQKTLATLRRPYSYPFSPALERDLTRELSHPFDALHLSHTWAGWLGLAVRSKALLSVLSLAAIDSDPSTRFREELERRVMLHTEHRLIRAYSVLRTLSPRLARAVSRLNPTANVHTVPFAFDASPYPLVRGPGETAPVIGLFGSMKWSPSRRAAERFLTRLWPRIRQRAPHARALIAGYGARVELARHLDEPGVSIVEDVPDMRHYFEQATLLLYPAFRATGVKVKVLEAFAYGVPVITTPEGAEGLPIEAGTHALVADGDDALIELTLELLRDAPQRERLRVAGRALVERSSSPDSVADGFEVIYRGLGKRR